MALWVCLAPWHPSHWDGSLVWLKYKNMAFLWLIWGRFWQKKTNNRIFLIQDGFMSLLASLPLGWLTAHMDGYDRWRWLLMAHPQKIFQKLLYNITFYMIDRLGRTITTHEWLIMTRSGKDGSSWLQRSMFTSLWSYHIPLFGFILLHIVPSSIRSRMVSCGPNGLSI